MINETLIILYLVWYWIMCILYKDNLLPNKLENLGHKLGKNIVGYFILGVSECRFCMDFWSSSFAGLIAFSYCLDYKYLLIGVFYSSISAHFRQ